MKDVAYDYRQLAATRRRLRVDALKLTEVSPRQRRVIHDYQVLVVVVLGAPREIVRPSDNRALVDHDHLV